jgi:hypothetical protein
MSMIEQRRNLDPVGNWTSMNLLQKKELLYLMFLVSMNLLQKKK